MLINKPFAYFHQVTLTKLVSRRYFSLLRDKNYVGGEWIAASSGKVFEVTNPVNDKVIGSAQDSTAQDAENAINVAASSFKKWAEVPAKEKGIRMKSLLKLVNDNADDLAKIITAECGKPLAEAKAEVMYSAGEINFPNFLFSISYIYLSFRLSGVVCWRGKTNLWRSAGNIRTLVINMIIFQIMVCNCFHQGCPK